MGIDTSDSNVDHLIEMLELGANNNNLLTEVRQVMHKLRTERNLLHYQLYGAGTTPPWMRAMKQREKK